MHARRSDRRVTDVQWHRPSGVEPLTHPNEESALLHFNAFIGGVKVRRHPVPIWHRELDGRFTRPGWITGDHRDEGARGEQRGRDRPLQGRRGRRGLSDPHARQDERGSNSKQLRSMI